MPNWCSNSVTFQGDEKNVREAMNCIQEMYDRAEKWGGVVPLFCNNKCEESFFFDLYIANDFSFDYESKWAPNIKDLNKIAERFKVNYSVRYYEPGGLIYGQTNYVDGEITDVALDGDMFPEYNEETSMYEFEGEEYEGEEEILEIELDRMLSEIAEERNKQVNYPHTAKLMSGFYAPSYKRMETIGKLLPNNKVELEYSGQGFIYKDFDAFKNKSDSVCYIPEYGISDDDEIEYRYTYQDFVDIAKDTFESLEVEGDTEKLAALLFEFCDWQSPETLAEEWMNMGEYEDYPEEYGIKTKKQ